MADRTPEIAGSSIVVVGSFNPTIVQPAWLASQDLIREPEAEDADIEIIHPEVVQYTIGWAQVTATRDRLSIGSTETTESPQLIRDLVMGILSLLRHTPVRHLGINKDAHYRSDSEEEWHAFGHRLVPPGNWAPVLTEPGTRSVSVQGARPDEYKGHVRVVVEPSLRIAPYGIYVSTNDHYVATNTEPPAAADELVEVLDAVWEPAMERAEQINDHLLGLTGGVSNGSTE